MKSSSLLENGLDFLLVALEHLKGEPKERDLKHAIINLSAGTELVLKERLRREHWALVFQDTDKADKTLYEQGDFASVNFGTCISRLEKICGIAFTERQKRTAKSLRDMRNRLEHFGLVASPDAIKGTAAHAVGFTFDFLHERIGMDVLEPSAEELLERIRALSGEFQRYVEKRMKVLEPKIAAAGTIVTCPACFQDAAAIDNGITCLFCHNRQPADEAADDFIAHIIQTGWRSTKDGLEWPRHDCPSCEADTLVDQGFDVSPRFLCFTCGETANLDWCPSCGRPATRDELDAGLCRNCIEDRLKRD